MSLSKSEFLWNIIFDNILKEDVPLGMSIIYYTHDTLAVMAEDDIPTLERQVNTALEVTTRYIESVKLSLTFMNMEVVLLTCCLWFSPL